MANPSTKTNEDAFNGTRFLLDATGAREYSITYKDGIPQAGQIHVFDGQSKIAFKDNEKIFAFDDAVETQVKGGAFRISTVAFQIEVKEGRPRRLLQQGVDYVMTFETKPGFPPSVSYVIAPESKADLLQNGFSESFPMKLSGTLAANDLNTKVSKGGIILPGAESAATPTAPFPPQHDGPALNARLYIETQGQQPEATPTPANDSGKQTGRFLMPDEQTLVEKKNLGDGESLKIVFNFESNRVTEVAPNRSANSFSFAEYGAAAIAAAAQQLKSMGGKPKGFNNG